MFCVLLDPYADEGRHSARGTLICHLLSIGRINDLSLIQTVRRIWLSMQNKLCFTSLNI